MIRDEKLKKINDIIFQEAEPSSDGKRPLEWRRSFNVIGLEVNKISVTSGIQLNDLEFRLFNKSKEDSDTKSFPQIKANPKKVRYISGTVIDCDDSIYYAVEEDKKKELYSFKTPPKPMTIQLQDGGECLRKDDYFPNGTYPGVLFYSEYSGSDNFHLEAQIPTAYFDDLIQALQDSTNPKLRITIALLSYSFEVDDALREDWMSRDLLIYETEAFAAVLNVFVKSKISGNWDQEEDEENQLNENDVTLNTNTIRKRNKQKNPFKKLSAPLWVIAFLLFLILLK